MGFISGIIIIETAWQTSSQQRSNTTVQWASLSWSRVFAAPKIHNSGQVSLVSDALYFFFVVLGLCAMFFNFFSLSHLPPYGMIAPSSSFRPSS